MKKMASALLALLLCLCLNLGLAEDAPSIAFDLSALTVREVTEGDQALQEIVLFKGKNAKLAFDVAGDAKAKLTWTSSDPKVAAVANGTVTAKGPGTAVITCTALLPDGTEATASVRVSVEVALTQLRAAKPTMSVPAGYASDPVVLTFGPANATCQAVTWTSEDESIATVSADGVVTGVKAGKVKITATSAELTAKPKTAVITVTVTEPVASITLDQSALFLAVGKNVKLAADVQPASATNKKVVWSSSDPKVASVANGAVTAKAPGTAVITCEAADGTGVRAECYVEVYAAVKSAAMATPKASVFMETAGTQLALALKPEGASYYGVSWASSDESVARVDENGLVSPVKGGKATITATITNLLDPSAKPLTAKCNVSVVQGVKEVTIKGSGDAKLPTGSTLQLSATVAPKDATNTKVTWSSSDKKVAMVSANGQVTIKGVGEAVITCESLDGSGAKDSIKLSVYQGVTSVSAKKSQSVVDEGQTVQLRATVKPDNAAKKKLTWSTSNSSIATVDEKGNVTGKRAGKVTITATSVDNPKKKAVMTVIVEPKIPLDAVTFTRSGYFGYYNEFAITFKNLTRTKSIKYIKFDLKYTYNGQTYTSTGFYDNRISLGPNAKKQSWWWDQLGFRLMSASGFRIYLTGVQYGDGSWDFFYEDNLIGWF